MARVEPYPYSGLEEILSSPEPLVLVLDGVTDPRNLGAVLRAADGAGAERGRHPEGPRRGVTAAAVKASAGASEHVRVARETNLKRAIDKMKEAGLWVYAAEAGGTPYTDLDLAGPWRSCSGARGGACRRLVREACDGTVSIPMLGASSRSTSQSLRRSCSTRRGGGAGGPDPGRLQRHRRPRPLQGADTLDAARDLLINDALKAAGWTGNP